LLPEQEDNTTTNTTSVETTQSSSPSLTTTRITKNSIPSFSSFSSSSYPYRILFVDDEADIIISIKKGLEDNGFVVDAFTEPSDALSAFRPELYDLLLIDVKMPQMNGFELYQKLRKKAAEGEGEDKKDINNIKICFITAYEVYYETLKKEFPGLNVGCFINKPIEIKDLVNRIREELEIV
jgi:two-component system catabolic regulation response regulator CreB/two-component system response regulator ChvI